MNSSAAGARWERVAERHLRLRGLKTLRRNFHCRLGEIDLVMKHGEITVFVEVRYRATSALGGAAQSVTRKKQLKLARAAGIFLSRSRRHATGPCRFDVVTITGTGPTPSIRWLRNAFESGLKE